MKTLEDFIRPTQKMLFDSLRKIYKNRVTVSKGNYLLVKGEAPIMLLAHLDTVHKEPVCDICKSERGNILMSPQGIGGDDRCGVYAITTVFEKSEVKPWLLFTCDEEKGGIGAEKFVQMHKKKKLPKALDNLKLLIEIDRRGKNDAVYYDCENTELEDYITCKGFVTGWGSYSDISTIAPELGVAAVNLSSGYYNAHTLSEYINRRHLNAVVKKVTEIVKEAADPKFPKYEYIECSCSGSWRRSSGFGRYTWSGFNNRGLTVKTTKTVTETKTETVIDENNFDIDQIPWEIRDDYECLLDYYTIAELEDLRADYGDRVIPQMCETELGFSYSSAGYSSLCPDDNDDDIKEEILYGTHKEKKKGGGINDTRRGSKRR